VVAATRNNPATTVNGIAHQRWRRDGSRNPSCPRSTGSVVSCVSVTLALSVDGLTTKAAIIAGLAIAALLLTGWRKPARAEPQSPREVAKRVGPARHDQHGVLVEHFDAPSYRRPGPIRRTLALIASGGIGILTGVIGAIVISFAIALGVIWMTNLLQR
jgi:hypothetical protein